MGKANQSCPVLKVHENVMPSATSDKYLGDKVVNSATIKPNIDQRIAKGYGIINHIALVSQVPLGWHRIIGWCEIHESWKC